MLKILRITIYSVLAILLTPYMWIKLIKELEHEQFVGKRMYNTIVIDILKHDKRFNRLKKQCRTERELYKGEQERKELCKKCEETLR